MKLLADENFPPTLISFIQKEHHDVKRIQRSTKGILDMTIREKAAKENRIVLTFDKDFLKTEKYKRKFSAVVFNFPYAKPVDIIPFMDHAIKSIETTKKRKKYFTAIYSVEGLDFLI